MKKLIIGLGNPGEKYKLTRHNVGKEIVEKLKDLPKDFLIGETNCFMNESGGDVKKLTDYYKVASGDLIIVHDDLDLEFGTVRFSFGGSAAGHKGVQSIIDYLKTDRSRLGGRAQTDRSRLGSDSASRAQTEDFWRVRVGIGRPPFDFAQGDSKAVESYVLQKFSDEEIKKLRAGVDKIKEGMINLESKTIYFGEK